MADNQKQQNTGNKIGKVPFTVSYAFNGGVGRHRVSKDIV